MSICTSNNLPIEFIWQRQLLIVILVIELIKSATHVPSNAC